MVKPFDKPIYVTRPFLPPLQEFCKGLEEIWESGQLTNNGPVLKRYARQLCDYLGTENLSLFNNGTLALQIALQGMGVTGEVITTPFTFVATTHALYWNKIRPVFVDIEPDYYTLDPRKVEEAITPWTTAILAVHVYGHPCNHEALADIARRHNLRLIYDAAHAFGVTVNGQSIAHLGDLSMFSFHATKLYHSLEGGMLVFKEPGLATTLDYLKNFGFKNQLEVVLPGTNAKMNEMQALMGLKVLEYLDEVIDRRRVITEIYMDRLKDMPGIKLPTTLPGNVKYNYAYMPILIDEKEAGFSCSDLFLRLEQHNVFSRRYFYPLVCDYSCYKNISIKNSLKTARDVSGKVLTLPIYDSLHIADVHRICDIIRKGYT